MTKLTIDEKIELDVKIAFTRKFNEGLAEGLRTAKDLLLSIDNILARRACRNNIANVIERFQLPADLTDYVDLPIYNIEESVPNTSFWYQYGANK